MKMGLCLGLCGLAGALAACTSLRSDKAEILVTTNPPGAACTLSRLQQPIGSVGPTPGIIQVDPEATTGLTLLCRRAGYADTTVNVPPNVTVSSWGSSYPEPQRIDVPLLPLRAPETPR
jgi:hypothetical protein